VRNQSIFLFCMSALAVLTAAIPARAEWACQAQALQFEIAIHDALSPRAQQYLERAPCRDQEWTLDRVHVWQTTSTVNCIDGCKDLEADALAYCQQARGCFNVTPTPAASEGELWKLIRESRGVPSATGPVPAL
jgi:hypothetical protein